MASVSRDETTIGVHADVSRPNNEQMTNHKTIVLGSQELSIHNHDAGITAKWERQPDENDKDWEARQYELVIEYLEPIDPELDMLNMDLPNHDGLPGDCLACGEEATLEHEGKRVCKECNDGLKSDQEIRNEIKFLNQCDGRDGDCTPILHEIRRLEAILNDRKMVRAEHASTQPKLMPNCDPAYSQEWIHEWCLLNKLDPSDPKSWELGEEELEKQ